MRIEELSGFQKELVLPILGKKSYDAIISLKRGLSRLRKSRTIPDEMFFKPKEDNKNPCEFYELNGIWYQVWYKNLVNESFSGEHQRELIIHKYNRETPDEPLTPDVFLFLKTQFRKDYRNGRKYFMSGEIYLEDSEGEHSNSPYDYMNRLPDAFDALLLLGKQV